MGYLAGLSEKLDGNAADGLIELRGCGGEGAKAAPLTGLELGAKVWQRRAIENDWKGLVDSGDGCESDGVAGDARVVQQVDEQGWRDEGLIDCQKDDCEEGSAIRSDRSERGADAAQRSAG
jgi:hypothetical protein